MLFIHGGDFTWGAASDTELLGENIVDFLGDVVVVTINYRLGVFGFLGGYEMQARDAGKSTGNFGIQDQRAAMQWV